MSRNNVRERPHNLPAGYQNPSLMNPFINHVLHPTEALQREAAARTRAGFDRILLRMRPELRRHLRVDDCEDVDTADDEDEVEVEVDEGNEGFGENEDYTDAEDMDVDGVYGREDEFPRGRSEWSDQFVDSFFEALSVRDHLAIEHLSAIEFLFDIDLHQDNGWTANLREWLLEIRSLLDDGELTEEFPGDCLENHFWYVEEARADLKRHHGYFMYQCGRGVKSCFVLLSKFVEDLCEMRARWPAGRGYGYMANTELCLLEDEAVR